jgi:ribosomal protein L35AE/L33A
MGETMGTKTAHQIGRVLAHVLDHRRARGGQARPRWVFLDVLAVGTIGQIRAVGDLDHLGEAERAQGAHQTFRILAAIIRGKGRRHHGHHGTTTRQKFADALDAAGVGLGALGTDHRAVAAGDAAFGHHRRLPVDDLDCLGRALAHARVAPAAILQDGLDHAHDRVLYPSSARRST